MKGWVKRLGCTLLAMDSDKVVAPLEPLEARGMSAGERVTWEEGAGAACGEPFGSWRELIGATLTEGTKDRTSETWLHVDKRRSKDDSDYGWAVNRRRKSRFEDQRLDLRFGHTSPCPAALSSQGVRSVCSQTGIWVRIS